MTQSATAEQTTETPADTSSLPDGEASTETTDVKDAETTADGPDERAAEDKPADEGKPEAEASDEPDYSGLQYPSDIEVADAYREEIASLGKDLGLAPDKVQALIDRDVARIKFEQSQAADQRQQWEDAAKADPDHAETQKNVDAALVAVPEFHAAAKEAGLLNHPAVRKLASALGAALAEPSSLPKGKTASADLSPRAVAQRDFPESPSEWPAE